MLAVVKSIGIYGLEGFMVEVEVDIARGLPGFDIVGLASTAVKEAKERVRAAVRNSGLEFPTGRITVNLAPADMRKEGPAFDLPIAVGLLAASGQITGENYKECVFLGELSLDGTIRGVTGVLPRVMVARKEAREVSVMVPRENADEASLTGEVIVYPASNLKEVAEFCNGKQAISRHIVDINSLFMQGSYYCAEDMSDVQGNYKVKRAMEVAAAGGHNILLVGSPGSGKTMLARRMQQIIPAMSLEEALETTKIYSVAGLLDNNTPLVIARPFRAPHHSVSKGGMIGGGTVPRPGEISLSHNGVLFMDEFPEFNKDTLESLRQPLEDGRVRVSRVTGSVEYPSRMMLVAAMNPCPCGFHGDTTRECTCTPWQISRYKNRISGPLLDRIDIHVEVPKINYQELNDHRKNESSLKIRERVQAARNIQQKRFAGAHISCNAGMSNKDIRRHCQLDKEAACLLKNAFEKLNLSARAYNRIIKVARTIADLHKKEDILCEHIAESVQYRSLDRKW